MKYYLGVTDNKWYKNLCLIKPEDVNFWQPSGTVSFKVIEPGAPFLFKLKAPMNVIGGLAFFSSHSFLPLLTAWEIFGPRNGCHSLKEFQSMILNYRNEKSNFNPTIGCIVLTDPIFFEEKDWIPTPADWGSSIVQGKSYSTESQIGNEVWTQVQKLIDKYSIPTEQSVELNDLEDSLFPKYSDSVVRKVRIGQGAFRVSVIEAYSRRCSISGEKTLPVLESAHIKPYNEAGPNKISNGILLRSDIHKLFDAGYLTITSEMNVEVSQRIKIEFENGREYYKYHGQTLHVLPTSIKHQPDKKYIEWHNGNIFKG